MSISEYDIKYSKDDYFNNRKWINNVYVKTIISKANIPRSAYLLDVGCGQGHFSYLFNKHGIQVLGIDLSKTGIQFAKYHYEKKGLHFEVYDLFKLPALFEFDYIFVRSLSLYNTKDIEQIQNTTETLMTHLKKNGLFIFCYNVNFNIKKQSDHWKFHNLDDINYYFSNYQSKVIYFSSKLDCILLGKFSFNKIFSYINMFASKLLGLGGEIVCFIKK